MKVGFSTTNYQMQSNQKSKTDKTSFGMVKIKNQHLLNRCSNFAKTQGIKLIQVGKKTMHLYDTPSRLINLQMRGVNLANESKKAVIIKNLQEYKDYFEKTATDSIYGS